MRLPGGRAPWALCAAAELGPRRGGPEGAPMPLGHTCWGGGRRVAGRGAPRSWTEAVLAVCPVCPLIWEDAWGPG